MKVMRTPRGVDLAITNACNLRCTYCSHFTSAGDVGTDLGIEEWLRFFEELNRCAVLNVCLQGGEPFYREDLEELIQGMVRNRMRFTILTNGTLISEEMAAFLARSGRCDGVQVSIDGSTAATHEACRGEGSLARAITGLKRLQRYGLQVTARTTIHRGNVRDLEGVAKLLLEDLGLSSLGTNSAGYMGLCRKNAESVRFSISEHVNAIETLLKLVQRYNGRIDAMAGPLAEAKNWLMMERARQQGVKSLPGGGYLTACRGPMTKIAVRADGTIVPCIQMSHMELGRINRDGLEEVWQEHPQLERLRTRNRIPLEDFAYCRGCAYIAYCTGNCPALAYTTTGEENHPSPDGCLRRFLEAGGRLPNETLLDT